MFVYINDLFTIKCLLREEFVKQTNPDVIIKIANCIELIDILEYSNKGYKIEYTDQIRVIKARKPVLENKILL